MLRTTSPNRPTAKSEKAIVVTLNALSSGARRKAKNASRAAGIVEILLREPLDRGLGRLRRIEHDLSTIQFDRAIIGATNQLEIVRRHDDAGAARVDVSKHLKDTARRTIVEISRWLVGDEQQ